MKKHGETNLDITRGISRHWAHQRGPSVAGADVLIGLSSGAHEGRVQEEVGTQTRTRLQRSLALVVPHHRQVDGLQDLKG